MSRGYYARPPTGWSAHLGIEKTRVMADGMEQDAARFLRNAADFPHPDADTRKLLGDLAAAEKGHVSLARRLGLAHTPDEDVHGRRDLRPSATQFVLTYVQPGLAGLMDGSVSTLAPIFAIAFATQDTWTTFLVGLCRLDRRRHLDGLHRSRPRRRSISGARIAAETWPRFAAS